MPKQVAPRASAAAWGGLKDQVRAARRRPTPAEDTLWHALRASKLGVRFRREHNIGTFYVDFYCVEAGLAIELDGPIHARQPEADRDRQEYIEANNIRVLRFNNEEVINNLPLVLQTIRSAIEDAAS